MLESLYRFLGRFRVLTPFHKSAAEIEQQANAALRYLENGEWAMLRQQFMAPLRLFLTESTLSSGWKASLRIFGSVQQIGSPVVTARWFGYSVQVPIQFSRSTLGLLFSMTPSGKLFGLNIAMQPSSPWKAPKYAATDPRESSLRLGRGLLRVNATLTLPFQTQEVGKIPCFILIGGSGPVDKDSTVGALKPFKDLALGLASMGIATCRFDKVTSTIMGKLLLRRKTMTLSDEYVHHVISAVHQIRQHPEIDVSRIFLLGHSLGALIAAKLTSTDLPVAGCILMAPPAEPMYRSAIRQLRYLSSLNSETQSRTNHDEEDDYMLQLHREAEIADSPSLSLDTPAKDLPFGLGPSYWLEYREFDARETLANVRKHVLFLQGRRDYQVTYQEDYAAFYAQLKDSTNLDFRVYDDLNHLFVAGEGRSTPLEYNVPGNVDFQVLRDIERWIQQLL
ncbi:hypothetical protein FALBO_17203 [Fusarium albosuccineum]|uniref:Serine aminopeptidase S33 domain-containing protein n=1 Tax=Fusarium albosuccineum TaxID=1237068 RepID=A0A8H4K9V1_9HYPO|nr:hypothetical protein FALBO_17203 [Fusarium albosuccineum]